jgi:hypothetical protein
MYHSTNLQMKYMSILQVVDCSLPLWSTYGEEQYHTQVSDNVFCVTCPTTTISGSGNECVIQVIYCSLHLESKDFKTTAEELRIKINI